MSDNLIRAYWIHATTPLHIGAGRGIGFVDLPIMREAVTNWPFVPGSSVKGVFADHYGASEAERGVDLQKKLAFGAGDRDVANAGSLLFADARLVCLPVRSFQGTFAWCSSPMALRRLKRDLDAAGITGLDDVAGPDVQGLHVPDSPASALVDSGKAFFEDLDFSVLVRPEMTRWAAAIAERAFPAEWRSTFCERFAVVHDDVFSFLCDTATQVDARVKISEKTKTAAGGALWYEESLPAETLLAGLVQCGRVFSPDRSAGEAIDAATLMRSFCSGEISLQMGGKATVGRGRVRLVFSGQAD